MIRRCDEGGNDGADVAEAEYYMRYLKEKYETNPGPDWQDQLPPREGDS